MSVFTFLIRYSLITVNIQLDSLVAPIVSVPQPGSRDPPILVAILVQPGGAHRHPPVGSRPGVVHQRVAGVQVAPAQPAPAPASTVLGEGELDLLEPPDVPLGCRVGGLLPLVAVVPLDLWVAEFEVELARRVSVGLQAAQPRVQERLRAVEVLVHSVTAAGEQAASQVVAEDLHEGACN